MINPNLIISSSTINCKIFKNLSLLCFIISYLSGTGNQNHKVHRFSAPTVDIELEKLDEVLYQVRTRGNSRNGSAHNSRPPSPHRQQNDLNMSQLQSTLTQLTAAVTLLAEGQVNQQRSQVEPTPIGPPPDPDFDWSKLLLPPFSAFPSATEGQVQQLAESLLSQVNNLKGRNHHEIRFLLAMASQYPRLSEEAQNVLYQRLNFFYIMVHHGWTAAISASLTSTNSLAVFPPGYIHQSSPRIIRRESNSLNKSLN